eukprot:58717_1
MALINFSSRCTRILNRCCHFNVNRFESISWNRHFSSNSNNGKYFCLFYDYVENVVEKRQPYRPAHLEYITQYVNDGKCKLAGAFADNFDGALIVFQCDDSSEVENFAKNDPYVLNGLVTNFKVRPWGVVTGDFHNQQAK